MPFAVMSPHELRLFVRPEDLPPASKESGLAELAIDVRPWQAPGGGSYAGRCRPRDRAVGPDDRAERQWTAGVFPSWIPPVVSLSDLHHVMQGSDESLRDCTVRFRQMAERVLHVWKGRTSPSSPKNVRCPCSAPIYAPRSLIALKICGGSPTTTSSLLGHPTVES